MKRVEQERVVSTAMTDFAKLMSVNNVKQSCSVEDGNEQTCKQTPRMNINKENVKNGLGQLVLTIVKLLHELLEKQAIRRIDNGNLSEDEIESLGITLMRQSQEIEKLQKVFGLKNEDLNLDLGPLGKLL